MNARSLSILAALVFLVSPLAGLTVHGQLLPNTSDAVSNVPTLCTSMVNQPGACSSAAQSLANAPGADALDALCATTGPCPEEMEGLQNGALEGPPGPDTGFILFGLAATAYGEGIGPSQAVNLAPAGSHDSNNMLGGISLAVKPGLLLQDIDHFAVPYKIPNGYDGTNGAFLQVYFTLDTDHDGTVDRCLSSNQEKLPSDPPVTAYTSMIFGRSSTFGLSGPDCGPWTIPGTDMAPPSCQGLENNNCCSGFENNNCPTPLSAFQADPEIADATILGAFVQNVVSNAWLDNQPIYVDDLSLSLVPPSCAPSLDSTCATIFGILESAACFISAAQGPNPATDTTDCVNTLRDMATGMVNGQNFQVKDTDGKILLDVDLSPGPQTGCPPATPNRGICDNSIAEQHGATQVYLRLPDAVAQATGGICELHIKQAGPRGPAFYTDYGDLDDDGRLDGNDPNPLVDESGQHCAVAQPDSDGDGIPDSQEISQGTNPGNPDSDQDGLTDCQETSVSPASSSRIVAVSPNGGKDGAPDANACHGLQRYKTNPLNHDSDGDGSDDGVEAAATSNPTDPGSVPSDQVPPIPDDIIPGDATNDLDGDHLTDSQEADLGTSPTDADSDHDGLTDCQETGYVPNSANPIGENTTSTRDCGGLNKYHTNPLVDDSDGDGIKDGEEVNGTYATAACSKPNQENGAVSSDRQALYGVLETLRTIPLVGYVLVSLVEGVVNSQTGVECPGIPTNPTLDDTDGDGLTDNREVGAGGAPAAGQLRTDPTDPDTDNDGLCDGGSSVGDSDDPAGPGCVGGEDVNNNGVKDGAESDAILPDTDGDGLTDCQETDYIPNTVVYEHAYSCPDPDGAGPLKGGDQFDTSPTVADSDGDLISDGIEVNIAAASGHTLTNPTKGDTDEDHLTDGAEDANHNGIKDTGETDPTLADTDNDGLTDCQETGYVANSANPVAEDTASTRDCGAGVKKYKTNPLVNDSDGDTIFDGTEVTNTVKTNPTKADTDADGLNDNVEDVNQDGIKGATESDPTLADTDNDGLTDCEETAAADSGTHQVPVVNTFDLGGSCLDPDGAGPLVAAHKFATSPVVADSDGDGLNDGPEVFRVVSSVSVPTNPTKPDSDDDTLTDCQETAAVTGTPARVPIAPTYTVAGSCPDPDGAGPLTGGTKYATDPLTNDSDNDGRTDQAEIGGTIAVVGEIISYGQITNPTNPDTDGDGLTDCRELGFTANSPDGGVTLATACLDPDSSGSTYVGGNPAYRTDALLAQSPDGDTVPDGLEVGVGPSGALSGTLQNSNPTKADTDDDGLKDDVEDANQNGIQETTETKAAVADSDGDGLTDCQETAHATGTPARVPEMVTYAVGGTCIPVGALPGGARYATDGTTSDSDHDGRSDSAEIAGTRVDGNYGQVTNPTKPDTDGDGLTDCRELGFAANSAPITLTTACLDPDGTGTTYVGGNPAYRTNAREHDSDLDGVNDGPETTRTAGVLSASAPTNPTSVDTDADSLTDCQETGAVVASGGVVPPSQDPVDHVSTRICRAPPGWIPIGSVDAGGNLTKYLTDPTVPDSDADTVNDGTEARIGTNPTIPDDGTAHTAGCNNGLPPCGVDGYHVRFAFDPALGAGETFDLSKGEVNVTATLVDAAGNAKRFADGISGMAEADLVINTLDFSGTPPMPVNSGGGLRLTHHVYEQKGLPGVEGNVAHFTIPAPDLTVGGSQPVTGWELHVQSPGEAGPTPGDESQFASAFSFYNKAANDASDPGLADKLDAFFTPVFALAPGAIDQACDSLGGSQGAHDCQSLALLGPVAVGGTLLNTLRLPDPAKVLDSSSGCDFSDPLNWGLPDDLGGHPYKGLVLRTTDPNQADQIVSNGLIQWKDSDGNYLLWNGDTCHDIGDPGDNGETIGDGDQEDPFSQHVGNYIVSVVQGQTPTPDDVTALLQSLAGSTYQGSGVDKEDPLDVNENGNVHEADGQPDAIEQRLVVVDPHGAMPTFPINIGTSGSDDPDPIKGAMPQDKTGFTVYLRQPSPSADLAEPAPLLATLSIYLPATVNAAAPDIAPDAAPAPVVIVEAANSVDYQNLCIVLGTDPRLMVLGPNPGRYSPGCGPAFQRDSDGDHFPDRAEQAVDQVFGSHSVNDANVTPVTVLEDFAESRFVEPLCSPQHPTVQGQPNPAYTICKAIAGGLSPEAIMALAQGLIDCSNPNAAPCGVTGYHVRFAFDPPLQAEAFDLSKGKVNVTATLVDAGGNAKAFREGQADLVINTLDFTGTGASQIPLNDDGSLRLAHHVYQNASVVGNVARFAIPASDLTVAGQAVTGWELHVQSPQEVGPTPGDESRFASAFSFYNAAANAATDPAVADRLDAVFTPVFAATSAVPTCTAGQDPVDDACIPRDSDGDGVPDDVEQQIGSGTNNPDEPLPRDPQHPESCNNTHGIFYICKTSEPSLLGMGIRIRLGPIDITL